MNRTTHRSIRAQFARLSFVAFALLLTLTAFLSAPLSASAASPSFTPSSGAFSSPAPAGSGSGSSNSGNSRGGDQTVIFDDLGVVKVVSVDGLDDDTATQHLTDLNDGATWTIGTTSGTLVFTPGDASGFGAFKGQINTSKDKNGAFAYKAADVERNNDGSYLAIALTGTLFQQDGHTYLHVDEQIGTGKTQASIKAGAEIDYYIEVQSEG